MITVRIVKAPDPDPDPGRESLVPCRLFCFKKFYPSILSSHSEGLGTADAWKSSSQSVFRCSKQENFRAEISKIYSPYIWTGLPHFFLLHLDGSVSLCVSRNSSSSPFVSSQQCSPLSFSSWLVSSLRLSGRRLQTGIRQIPRYHYI